MATGRLPDARPPAGRPPDERLLDEPPPDGRPLGRDPREELRATGAAGTADAIALAVTGMPSHVAVTPALRSSILTSAT